MSRATVSEWIRTGVITGAVMDGAGRVMGLPDEVLELDCLPREGELSIRAFTRVSGIARASVYRLIARGDLPGVRRSTLRPRNVYVPAADLDLVRPKRGEITISEFAERSGLSRDRIGRLIEQGKLTEVRRLALGGQIVIAESALDKPEVTDAPRRVSRRKPRKAPTGYVKLSEAAERSGISIATVRRWVRNGHLPEAIREGRRMYVPITSLRRMSRMAHESRMNGCRTRNAEMAATVERQRKARVSARQAD